MSGAERTAERAAEPAVRAHGPVPAEGFLPGPVRIVGTGLIGGSLGLALRAAGAEVQVSDISPGTTALAIELGVGRAIREDDEEPALVLVAAPPDVAAALVAEQLRAHPGAIVADVASVKSVVLDGLLRREAEGQLDAEQISRYIGGHPMAGRETSGVIAAQTDLFRGRPFVIVPHERTVPAAVSLLRRVAVEIGSLPVNLSAAEHDAAVAHVSHAPQVVASLLGAALLDAQGIALDLAGQGLRDTSRIAASDPRLWVEILSANARALTPVLEDIRGRLDSLIGSLATLQGDPDPAVGSRREVARLIADGNAGVARIPGKHGSGTDSFAAVVVLVPDAPGELGRLLTEMGQIGVNLEDLRLEHSLGQPVGLAHVAVARAHESLLTTALRERGWTVADA